MKASALGTILLAMLLAACQPAADKAPAAATPADPAATAAGPAATPAQDAAPAADGDAPKPEIPTLEVATIDGGRFDLAEQRGKWVVVNFWATWCSPCLKEMPELSALDAMREHIVTVGLAYEEISPEDMQAFLKDHPVVYPIAVIDVFSPPADFETPRGLPMTYLIAPDGKVWVTNRAEDTVTVHDPGTLEKLATLDSKGFPIRVVFARDGRHALVSNATAGTLSVFDAASHALVATVALKPEGEAFRETMLGKDALPIGIAVDPHRPRVYVAISGANRIAVVDSEAWRVIDYWRTGNQPDALGIVVGARD